jgi:hypothetical protein
MSTGAEGTPTQIESALDIRSLIKRQFYLLDCIAAQLRNGDDSLELCLAVVDSQRLQDMGHKGATPERVAEQAAETVGELLVRSAVFAQAADSIDKTRDKLAKAMQSPRGRPRRPWTMSARQVVKYGANEADAVGNLYRSLRSNKRLHRVLASQEMSTLSNERRTEVQHSARRTAEMYAATVALLVRDTIGQHGENHPETPQVGEAIQTDLYQLSQRLRADSHTSSIVATALIRHLTQIDLHPQDAQLVSRMALRLRQGLCRDPAWCLSLDQSTASWRDVLGAIAIEFDKTGKALRP